jgi:hypothetical protein
VCGSGDRVEFATAQLVHDQGVTVYVSEAKELIPEGGYEVQEALEGYRPINPVSANLCD